MKYCLKVGKSLDFELFTKNMSFKLLLFRLKEGFGFHLFITTSPCGDARIFSLHESSSTNSLEAKPASKPEVETEAVKPQEPEIAVTTTEETDKSAEITNDPIEKVNVEEPEKPVENSGGETTEETKVEEEPKDPNNNEELENFGNDEVAIYVIKAEEPTKRQPRPMSDSSR